MIAVDLQGLFQCRIHSAGCSSDRQSETCFTSERIILPELAVKRYSILPVGFNVRRRVGTIR